MKNESETKLRTVLATSTLGDLLWYETYLKAIADRPTMNQVERFEAEAAREHLILARETIASRQSPIRDISAELTPLDDEYKFSKY